jgi:hypothetical protein
MDLQIQDASYAYDSDRNPSLGGMWLVERLFRSGLKKENVPDLW